MNLFYHFCKKNSLPMRLLVLSLFLSLGVSWANHSYAQSARISIDAKNKTIAEILETVEQQSEFSFIYDSRAVDTQRKLSVQAENTNIFDVLDQMFSGSDVAYTVINQKIILTKGDEMLNRARQGITITGTVTDDTGVTMPGVNISVKGTLSGVVSDVNGRYSITVPSEDAVLVFSFVGYTTQEVVVGSQRNINSTLSEDTRELEEIIVIGYGTVRKSDLTGSIVSISNDKFKNLPQTGVTQILQGKAAGVNITSTSGAGSTNIRIRGITSLNKSNEPLWVVDGVIGGVIGNFHDIQSIEVLKDASATAIYGSQGANGVILVTTKRAQEGKAVVTLDTRLNWRTMRKKPDLLSPYEWATAYNYVNGPIISDADMTAYKNGTKGLDWVDLMIPTGFTQTYSVNLSGGTAKSRYKVSAWVNDDKAQLVTVSSKNYNIKASMDAEIAPWLELSGYMYGSTGSGHNGIGQGQFSNITTITPCMELQAADGTFNVEPYYGDITSPMGSLKGSYTDRENTAVSAFTDLKIKFPIDGLTLSLQGFYSANESISRYFQSSKRSPSGLTEANNNTARSHSLRNINNLTYRKDFGDHHLTAMAVFEATKYEWSQVLASNRNLSQESLEYWALAGGNSPSVSNDYTNSAMVSTFGRVIYSYKSKYLFTGTMRADAPSQFRGKYKWGYFPSAAVGWNIAEEDFMNKDLIQQLKLRASAGTIGNHGVDAYATMLNMTLDKYSFGMNQQYGGYWLNAYANPKLRWEKTTQYNIGVDLGTLNQRVNLTVDWFLKKTTDLLFNKAQPYYYGGGNMWVNQGRVDNSGWEFTATAWPVQNSGFTWESTLTASYTKTVVKDLAGEKRIIPDEGRGNRLSPIFVLEPGREVGVFRIFDFAGFDNQGTTLYRKNDGSTTTSPQAEDRVILGNSIPKWIFGWNNQFKYQNWDLNIFFRATSKYNRLNLSDFFHSSRVASYFITTRDAYYKNWDMVTDKSQAKYSGFNSPGNVTHGPSTQFLEQAAFLRLQNLSLGYQIPRKTTKVADIHLSLSCENMFVLTKYSGLDPETVSEVSDTYRDNTFGIDDGSFPVPRAWTFNVRFDF